jgi:hypothetical protein
MADSALLNEFADDDAAQRPGAAGHDNMFSVKWSRHQRLISPHPSRHHQAEAICFLVGSTPNKNAETPIADPAGCKVLSASAQRCAFLCITQMLFR